MATRQMALEFPARRAPMIEVEEDRAFGQPHRGHVEDVEMVVRMPRGATAAIAAARPEDVQAFLKAEAQRMLDELCTPWSTDAPKYIGLYEITDHATGVMRELWWWSGITWYRETDPHRKPWTDADLRKIVVTDFAKLYAWRGLRERPREPYPCPPYRVDELPKGAHTIDVRVEWVKTHRHAAGVGGGPVREIGMANQAQPRKRAQAEPPDGQGNWLTLENPVRNKPTLTRGLHEIILKGPDGAVTFHGKRWWNGKAFEGDKALLYATAFYAVVRRIPGGKPDACTIVDGVQSTEPHARTRRAFA